MANLNLGQDVANKVERKLTAVLTVAKSYLLKQAEKMRRYGSLVNINPSVLLEPVSSCCPILPRTYDITRGQGAEG